MAKEQTFKSPGFFDQEIDLSARTSSPTGTPAGVVGTSEGGPAFVPVTLGSFEDFKNIFGENTLSANRFGPHAVREWLKHRNSATYMRVLGAGSNDTISHIETTRTKGIVRNAGFKIQGSATSVALDNRHKGSVQFLCAQHFISSTTEPFGFPTFTDNDSYGSYTDGATDTINLVRGIILTATGTRVQVMDGEGYVEEYADGASLDDFARMDATNSGTTFKLILSSTSGTPFGNDESKPGIRILTASFDPSNKNYFGKILNTDPNKFQSEEHLLYADFAVENELAPVVTAGASVVGILSGSAATSAVSGDTSVTFRDLFGRFDTRYTTPKSPMIISQPYGSTEFNLFSFEAISDGAYANEKYKISIANIKASTDPNNKFGTFEVQVRRFGDTDINKEIVERYPDCNLNPFNENYVAKKIGDNKVYFDFDADHDDERRLVIEGKYPNRSIRIRVLMDAAVERQQVPETALPFGFRGIEILKTSESLTDDAGAALLGFGSVDLKRLGDADVNSLTGSIVPPLPYRFKATRGDVSTTKSDFIGSPGVNERVDSRLYFGVKFERMPLTASLANSVLNTNVSALQNPLVKAYSKFFGIRKLDALVTGSAADAFNNNKFTLARVALYNDYANITTDITGTADEHMVQAAYIRNGSWNGTTYAISDTLNSAERVTLASLVHSSSAVFNRFADYNKFSCMLYGGFDGLNILDRDSALMNDKAASTDAGGKAATAYSETGLTNNPAGTGKDNSIISSYRTAARIMTDPLSVNTNVLVIPGIKDSFITDYALQRTRDYAMAIYLMDTLEYDEDKNRLFDDDTAKPDVRETKEQFDARAIDNSYGTTYFPQVWLQDPDLNKPVKVPATIAGIASLAFNDKVGYPWFAPAGFNRNALNSVTNVDVRLSKQDRDDLYDARINPIATFPKEGFAIFGQKTLQRAKSALDRINVRRMLLEVKRSLAKIAMNLAFEINDKDTRERFKKEAKPILSLVQVQAGIEKFLVIMDDTNNSAEDADALRMNGKILLVPTLTIEFIKLDFIITRSGILFS